MNNNSILIFAVITIVLIVDNFALWWLAKKVFELITVVLRLMSDLKDALPVKAHTRTAIEEAERIYGKQ